VFGGHVIRSWSDGVTISGRRSVAAYRDATCRLSLVWDRVSARVMGPVRSGARANPVQLVLQRLIEVQAAAVIGRGRYERPECRVMMERTGSPPRLGP
jgi:hypothetical protein